MSCSERALVFVPESEKELKKALSVLLYDPGLSVTSAIRDSFGLAIYNAMKIGALLRLLKTGSNWRNLVADVRLATVIEGARARRRLLNALNLAKVLTTSPLNLMIAQSCLVVRGCQGEALKRGTTHPALLSGWPTIVGDIPEVPVSAAALISLLSVPTRLGLSLKIASVQTSITFDRPLDVAASLVGFLSAFRYSPLRKEDWINELGTAAWVRYIDPLFESELDEFLDAILRRICASVCQGAPINITKRVTKGELCESADLKGETEMYLLDLAEFRDRFLKDAQEAPKKATGLFDSVEQIINGRINHTYSKPLLSELRESEELKSAQKINFILHITEQMGPTDIYYMLREVYGYMGRKEGAVFNVVLLASPLSLPSAILVKAYREKIEEKLLGSRRGAVNVHIKLSDPESESLLATTVGAIYQFSGEEDSTTVVFARRGPALFVATLEKYKSKIIKRFGRPVIII